MAYKFSKEKRPIDTDHTSDDQHLSSVPTTVPNSAMPAAMSINGTVENMPNSAMSALQNQRPAAEAEADRLSAGITSTTPEGLRREMGRLLKTF